MSSALPPENERLQLPEGSIFSERLELRMVTYRDLHALLKIHRVEEVNRYLPFETWRGMDDAEIWFDKVRQRHRDREAIQWVICDRTSGAICGSCILFGYEHDHERIEIGYGLGRHHWGRGVAREAVSRLISYAFDDMAVRRIDARVDPRNDASNGLLERLGFTLEGRQRERQLLKGELVDVNLWGLLRSRWPQAQK
ncbi:GNAT family N-acetyltransferase [Halioglobus maricola]|nr:GNAT family N-acetyltransferase [Halioglobus maricola]